MRGFPSVKAINTERVTNIAVNMEQIMPALKVTANPLMGPEPIHANTKAAIRVVILASKMVIKARSYPAFIAARTVFPRSSSSRIRSKIITLASLFKKCLSTVRSSVSVSQGDSLQMQVSVFPF